MMSFAIAATLSMTMVVLIKAHAMSVSATSLNQQGDAHHVPR